MLIAYNLRKLEYTTYLHKLYNMIIDGASRNCFLKDFCQRKLRGLFLNSKRIDKRRQKWELSRNLPKGKNKNRPETCP